MNVFGVELEGRVLRWLTWLAIAVCCAPPLYLGFLPMMELPQYVALSRMLFHLSDPHYGFGEYYELALDRSIAVVPLYLLGGLSELLPHAAATRLVTWLSVLSYPLGLCALLRAQQKPLALALLSLPVVYAAPFYLGLLPSLASAGLALYVIALLQAPVPDRRALALVGAILPFTHPFGVCIALAYVCSMLCVSRSSRRQVSSLALALLPLALGAVYWGARALRADGVAAFNYPGLAFRLLRLPESILGGFLGRGEAYLLAGMSIVWLLLCRGQWPASRERWRTLADAERALWLTFALCVLGYLLLPSSTWSTTAIHVRSGSMAFGLMPVLVPKRPIRVTQARASALLLALAGCSIWFTTSHLIQFDREAQPFAATLARAPTRPKLISLTYDSRGELARGNPYVHFAAYVQAERGGFLALSAVDYAWTAPLRRRAGTGAVAPVYGSEWDPVLMHDHPEHFVFCDAVISRGTEPREMTMMTIASFQLAAQGGKWLLYLRKPAQDLDAGGGGGGGGGGAAK